jgi:DNA-directed RNA polymerase specialized sigma24 family protein
MTNSRSRSRRPPFTITFVEDRGAAVQFKELTLPLLGEVYTVARYLLDSAADADDAVQECYLRAFRHFDTYHGPAIQPWPFTILRNVCNAEFARRSKVQLRNTECDAETLEPDYEIEILASGAPPLPRNSSPQRLWRKSPANSDQPFPFHPSAKTHSS